MPHPRTPADDPDSPTTRDAAVPRVHHLHDIALHVFESPVAAARYALGLRSPRRGVAVFTCNVDHLMLARVLPRFRDAYGRSDVATIDGAPLALLSRWTGTTGATRVTGVDLTWALLQVAARERLTVALVGGAPGRAERAAVRARALLPGLPTPVTACPPMGFTPGDPDDAQLVAELAARRPDVVVVCLGAPRQELWIDRHRADLPGAVLVGAGATVDYLSGEVSRAPAVFRRTGTEALYRLATDGRRLWRRYLVRDARFLAVFASTLVGDLAARAGVLERDRAHPGHALGASGARDCWACAAGGARP